MRGEARGMGVGETGAMGTGVGVEVKVEGMATEEVGARVESVTGATVGRVKGEGKENLEDAGAVVEDWAARGQPAVPAVTAGLPARVEVMGKAGEDKVAAVEKAMAAWAVAVKEEVLEGTGTSRGCVEVRVVEEAVEEEGQVGAPRSVHQTGTSHGDWGLRRLASTTYPQTWYQGVGGKNRSSGEKFI